MSEQNTNNNTDLIDNSRKTPAEAKNNDADGIDADFTEVDTEHSTTEFFPVSEGKLITLYILSFGLYGFYWFYKNWQLQQPKMDKKILPFMRATFSIFFTHSLFKRIDARAANLEQKHKFNASTLATLFVATVIVSNILDRSSMNSGIIAGITSNSVIITSLVLFIISAYPLVAVQATVNRINNDMLGYLNHKYSIWNYLLIALGIIFWLILAMNMLVESMGLIPAQQPF